MRSALGLVAVAVLASCSSKPPAAVTQCAADETLCGTSCAKLRTDDAHCGSCDKPCPTGTACGNSACFPVTCAGKTCAADQVCDSDACIDKSCVGVACPAGQTCSMGICSCASPSRSCGGACVDPRTDEGNCGACGSACTTGTSCAAGACLPDDCPGADCDPLSVCYQGACTEKACVGVVCAPSQSCHGGVCGCAANQTSCGATCTNPKTDDANCGTCGNACPSTQRCAAGQCLPKDCPGTTCDPLSVCFGGSCTEASCVGVACGGGKVCGGGLCQCATGKTDCGGACAALATDTQHCGACATVCAAGQACSAGSCVTNTCTGGKQLCGSSCVDTQTDPANCNGCGAACGGGRNCVGGACSCPSGLTFCGNACVNLGTDTGNCGMCGRSCNGGSCSGGVCSCPSGSSPCNGSCVTTASDPNNCGMCARVCGASQACDGGVCGCPAGQSLCGGACIPTLTDNTHCGGCNTVCPSNQYCNNGACVPPFICQTNYASPPANCPAFPLNISNCGNPGTPTTSGPFTGTLTAVGQLAVLPFTLNQNERVKVSNTVTGGANVETTINTNWPVDVARSYDTTSATTPKTIVLTSDGSPYACSHPINARVLDGFSSPVNYSVLIDRIPLSGKYNAGSSSFATATPFATPLDGGLACDQTCGAVRKVCPDNSDDRQHYGLVIPARRAAVFEFGFNGSANIHFTAIQASGNTICNLANNLLIGNTWSFYKARLVNNTDVDQPVVVFPWAFGSGGTSYQISAAIEP